MSVMLLFIVALLDDIVNELEVEPVIFANTFKSFLYVSISDILL